MATRLRRVVLVTATVLLVAGATEAGTQGAGGAQGLSETLAELNALGLQVEVQAVEAAGVQTTTVPLALPSRAGAASAEITGNRVQESVWGRLRDLFGRALERTTQRLIDDAIAGIQDACRINLTADEGFELAFVAVALGGVTATFRPSPEFCRDNPFE